MASNVPALIVPPAPTAAEGTNDIRAIKPPVEIPNDWAWLWWALIALLLLLALFLAWRWWQRRQLTPASVIIVPPHHRARHRLAQALELISDPRRFCTAVSDALRIYLEERFDFRAPERTTEEFLLELQTTHRLSLEQKRILGDFLQSCDLVKFARFEPTEAALRDLHDSALRLVDETAFDPLTTGTRPATGTPSESTPPALPPGPPPPAPAQPVS